MKKEECGRKVCPVCGKPFYILVEEREWAYHIARMPYADVVCSWHCAVESEKKYKQRKAAAKKAPIALTKTRKNSKLGDELNATLVRLRITKKEAAQEMGVSPTAVGYWANCLTIPHGDNLVRLQQFLDERRAL